MPSARRRHLLLAAIATVIAGLGVHFVGTGVVAGLIADGLYTVMLYFVFGVIFPKARSSALAIAAFTLSALVEFAQLSSVTASIVKAAPPLRLILGTTFSAFDLLAYAVGALLVWAVDSRIR